MTVHTPDPHAEAESVEELIIRMSTLSYERMPMLEVIFDRYMLSLGSALKSFCGVPVDVSIESFSYLNCGEAMAKMPSPTLLAITSADPWEGAFLTSIDPAMLFSTLEIMLGGRASQSRDWTPRSFTAIEKRFGTRLVDVVLSELSRSFRQLSEVSFSVDHLESNPRATALAPASSPCVAISLNVSLEDRGGKLDFLIPFNTLEKIRSVLAQPFLGGKLGGDSSWRKQLTAKIEDTTVTLDALLCELKLPMTEVLSWQKGQTVQLGIDAEHEVTLVCSDRPMFRGAMGRRANGSVALRLTEEIEGKDGTPDDEPTD